jgi:hypothetical protein
VSSSCTRWKRGGPIEASPDSTIGHGVPEECGWLVVVLLDASVLLVWPGYCWGPNGGISGLPSQATLADDCRGCSELSKWSGAVRERGCGGRGSGRVS